jgi:MFS family permease
VIVGRLLPQSLYSTGNSVAQMVAFGIGPIVGAGLGGYVYEHLGAHVTFLGASLLASSAGVVAWFALSAPELARPGSGRAGQPTAIEMPFPGPDPTS